MTKNLQFEPLYPDVLGAIAGTMRVSFDASLQAAVGIFPRRAYLNQPFEVIIILQNMIDQNLEVKIELQLPKKAEDGSPLVLSTPKKQVTQNLSAGEVGVLRLPVIALLPTQPADDVPIRVLISQRSRSGKQVRTPARGAPPSALAVSPFKLQALRDIEWIEHPSHLPPGNIPLSFGIDPKKMPPVKENLKTAYEVLWTREQMKTERSNILSKIDEARKLANSFTRVEIFDSLFYAVDDAYAARGLPLHPGETAAITKMLTYALDDRSRLDPNYKLEEQRWFQALCQVLAHDEKIASWTPGEIVVRYLFEPVMYEAVLLAFTVIRSRVKVNLGELPERISYANKLVNWLSGQGEPDLIYIYLPLALGGVVVNHQVTWQDDDPWKVVDGLREAYRGRVRLVTGDAMEIFDILDKLLTRAEEELRRARIQR